MYWNFPKLKIDMKRQFQAARANRLWRAYERI
jgi:hypothetical protein